MTNFCAVVCGERVFVTAAVEEFESKCTVVGGELEHVSRAGWVDLAVSAVFLGLHHGETEGVILSRPEPEARAGTPKCNRRNSAHGCRRIATERRAQIVESGTIGGILFLGSHQVLFWCPLLAQVALSSGEAELNSSVHCVKERIGFVYMLRERIGER